MIGLVYHTGDGYVCDVVAMVTVDGYDCNLISVWRYVNTVGGFRMAEDKVTEQVLYMLALAL